ncbi:elongation factor P [Iodidimonas sp. SYSU 1G8]|jgi:elongation factor P|uniref:elongation factor P n=1 Tax=Iodidimonas sp. SYSU 1G8 TaxID=3133967 RepID=UPI0031FEE6BB
MKVNGNAIKPGYIIEHNGGLWRAVRTEHTQPGKGGAYLQVELKNIRDGSKLNERFRAAEAVERVQLELRPFQYLYGDDDNLTFMNTENYEQIEIKRELAGEQSVFLQDGMMVEIAVYEDEPLSVQMPQKVILEVAETEPVMKGQTAANSYKPAILANGVRVSVPPFVGTGDKVVVNTETFEYMERA